MPPMRPQMVSQLPTGGAKWIYEPKLDGYRAIAVRGENEMELFSMEGRRFNERFPKVVEALNRLTPAGLVLDGELVALEANGRPNFNELQNAAKTKLPIHYVVFDVLHHQGKDLLDLPLEARKAILDEVAREFVKPLEEVLVFPANVDLNHRYRRGAASQDRRPAG